MKNDDVKLLRDYARTIESGEEAFVLGYARAVAARALGEDDLIWPEERPHGAHSCERIVALCLAANIIESP